MNERSLLQPKSRVAPAISPLRSGPLQRKCACGGSSGLTGSCSECEKKNLLGQPLQTKLRIHEAGDAYEQEADRVAARVMQMPEASFKSSERQSYGMMQRRVAGDELSNSKGPVIQRAEAAGEMAASEDRKPKDTGPNQDDGSRCPSWRADPESISKRAAETYVQNDMTPPSQATVERIDCEPPRANGNYGCYVHFSDGLVIRVIVRAQDVVVGVPPINTWTPPPATPLCFYDYHCPEGLLVLTLRECKSAKPAGPTTIVQRRSVVGGAGLANAAPLVNNVLSSPGQPLDAATRGFFSARFGHDFANVRVHADPVAAESARSVNALAYTVGHDIVFGTGQYSPGTQAGQRLLAHELTHVVQQSAPADATEEPVRGAHAGVIQRQPETEPPTFPDFPGLFYALEKDVGKNLRDYGHHLYQASILHPDEPHYLENALSRYALGLNVLKTSYRFAGLEQGAADKLALGTGILFKGLNFVQEGEFVLDFQIDIGKGLKLEANLDLGVNPDKLTEVRKTQLGLGLVGEF